MNLDTAVMFPLAEMDSALNLFHGQDRPSGTHATQILWQVERAIFPNKYKKSKMIEQDGRDLLKKSWTTEQGFAWERICCAVFRERMIVRRQKTSAEYRVAGKGKTILQARPDLTVQQSLHSDGVWMTPDAIDYEDDPPTLEEYKATTRSVRAWNLAAEKGDGALEMEFWYWLTQIKCYLRALGLTRARLFVWWICGDYMHGQAEVWMYELSWTQEELDASWTYVLDCGQSLGLLPTK